jgi:hypothetical protein
MRDTIDMAREAEIIDPRDAFSEAHVQAVLQDLKAFEALVRADQREIDAKVCEDAAEDGSEMDGYDTAYNCAATIRARGQA